MKNITSEELQKRLNNKEDVHILDVRENNEVAAGNIPGAKHIPLGHLAMRKNELDKDRSYVVVCQSGNRSKAGCGILEALGYEVENLVGGMNEWKGAIE
ncbi:rhodanese-like domain-containing protein [Salirhabdus sp. Marseille-P4669]|uniref:rhodanese-like domain-containing protein n=1 Tax=Salirhabdus sp. Marseille-P4669 TaxID=2042310 RepID=UPI000C7C1AAF|nr:rhodanese-like domain-containing protein [Salirhabdus sp. Marseille-P4669]